MASGFDRVPKRSGAPAGKDVPANPAAETPLAVALQYAPEDEDSAPVVVASGRGEIAERIMELAFANGIRVREDADLAELLSNLDLGDEIPVEAFVAVAERLRYVYAANGTKPPEISPHEQT